MATKSEIDEMKQDIKDNRVSCEDNEKDIIRIGAHQKSNYDSLQRIEGKQDKSFYIILGSLVSLVITLIVIGLKMSK